MNPQAEGLNMMNATSVEGVRGFVAAGFDGVVRVFRSHLPDLTLGGAALSIFHDGVEVVNVHAGTADPRSNQPWTETTLNVLFSVTKGLAALVVARLAQDGRIDVDAPVAELWPEFGSHGKSRLTLGDVLAHRAGLSAPRVDLTLEQVLNHDRWAAEIANQEPLWDPGKGHTYHAFTFGPLVQEVIQRATGRELHEHFDDLLARPLAADATLKANSDELDRTAFLTVTEDWRNAAGTVPADIELQKGRALTLGAAFPRTLVDGESGFNDRRVQSAGLAGGGGLGTASALARIWSAAIVETDGIRVLNDASVERLSMLRSEGPQVFDPRPPHQRWGAGVLLNSEAAKWFSPASFGHGGAGGQVGIADPQLGVALGYVRNQLDVHDPVPSIIEAARAVFSSPTASGHPA